MCKYLNVTLVTSNEDNEDKLVIKLLIRQGLYVNWLKNQFFMFGIRAGKYNGKTVDDLVWQLFDLVDPSYHQAMSGLALHWIVEKLECVK